MDAFLFKAFKFFDLYNNGALNKIDFFKAIAKCGVVVDTHVVLSVIQDVDAVFQNYSKGQDRLDYKQFI